MSKKNMYLGGVLVVLLVLAFLYSGPLDEWRANLGKPDNFFKQVEFEDLDKMEIQNGDDQTTLVEEGDKWKVEGTKGFYVTGQVMNRVIEALDSAQESDLTLVSELSEKKPEFDLDEASRVLVNFINGDNTVLQVAIGKNAQEPGSTYVALPDSEKSYLVSASLNSAFDHDQWYDKQIFSVDKDSINKVRFQYPSREFTIEKEETEEGEASWSGTLPYIFSVDDEKVDEILDVVSDLKASEIPEQTFEGTGLEKNLIIVQFSGEEIDQTIMIGEDNGEGLYYAKRGDSDNIYLITEEQRDMLEKRISDLR